MKRILVLLGAVSIILTSCGNTAKYYAANGVELNIDMSDYSENAKLLTADDIYLLSYNCGYISGNPPVMMIVENQDQLDYAGERYGLALPPEGLSKYPISDYSYVIEYVVVGSGGYDLRVGALLVDYDILHFVRTADSKTPDPESVQPAVMDGFCYMAAVPKGTLMNEHYDGWTYPDKDDM